MPLAPFALFDVFIAALSLGVMGPAVGHIQKCLHLSLCVSVGLSVCEFQDVGAALAPTSETGNLNLLCHRRRSGQNKARLAV